MFFAIFVSTSFATLSNGEPPAIQVTVGNITDTRRTGDHAGEMKIQLKLAVAGITNDAKGFRVVVAKALDDAGLDLINRPNVAPAFKGIMMTKDFELKLKNPARKAGSIKELSGDVELFVPKNDRAASVIVKSFPKQMGTPIQSDALKAAGIEIVAQTRAEYEALQEKKEKERSKTGQRNQPAKFGPNDIVVSIKGATETVFACEFHDPSDLTIQPSGSMDMHRYQDKQEFERNFFYDFDARLPETTTLVVFIVTRGALVKVPFALADTKLP